MMYLSRKQKIVVLKIKTKNCFEKLAGQLAQMHGKRGINFGKNAFVKELSWEMLVELAKGIRVRGKDIMDIVFFGWQGVKSKE